MPSNTRRRVLRIGAAVAFAALAVICLLGLLACVFPPEGDDWADFWHWAVGFALVGLSSLFSAAWLIIKQVK